MYIIVWLRQLLCIPETCESVQSVDCPRELWSKMCQLLRKYSKIYTHADG